MTIAELLKKWVSEANSVTTLQCQGKPLLVYGSCLDSPPVIRVEHCRSTNVAIHREIVYFREDTLKEVVAHLKALGDNDYDAVTSYDELRDRMISNEVGVHMFFEVGIETLTVSRVRDTLSLYWVKDVNSRKFEDVLGITYEAVSPDFVDSKLTEMFA